jgi:hypothetical protein
MNLQPSGMALILDCLLVGSMSDEWATGALHVLDPSGVVKTGADRSTYFDGRTGQLLYGEGGSSFNGSAPADPANRWWRELDLAIGDGVSIVAVELLAAVPFASLQRSETTDSRIAVLICHVQTDARQFSAPVLQSLWSTLRDRTGRNRFYQSMQTAIGAQIILGGRFQASLDGNHTYITESPRVFSVVLEEEPVVDAHAVDQFGIDDAIALRARVLASLTPSSALGGLDASRVARARASLDPLSASWAATVLRDGAAFLMRPHKEFAAARMLVSTIYTDALAMVRLEANIAQSLAHATGALVYDTSRLTLRSIALAERDLTIFRSMYRKHSLNPADRVRTLMAGLETELGVPEAIDSLASELNDLVRIVTLDQQVRNEEHGRRVDAIVALFAIIGFPLTIALPIWQSVDQINTLPGLIAVSTAAVAVGAIAYGFIVRLSRRSKGLFDPGPDKSH